MAKLAALLPVARGLPWGSIALYGVRWCAPAARVLLERPAAMVPQYVDVPVRVVQPYMLPGGGDERKETWIAARVAGPVKLRPEVEWPALTRNYTGPAGLAVLGDKEAREGADAQQPAPAVDFSFLDFNEMSIAFQSLGTDFTEYATAMEEVDPEDVRDPNEYLDRIGVSNEEHRRALAVCAGELCENRKRSVRPAMRVERRGRALHVAHVHWVARSVAHAAASSAPSDAESQTAISTAPASCSASMASPAVAVRSAASASVRASSSAFTVN